MTFKNITVVKTAIISAATIELQIPSTPHKSGNISTAAIWNIRVLKKAIAAETGPSLSAVKKDEPKMANPENRNENENMPKARTVRASRSAS